MKKNGQFMPSNITRKDFLWKGLAATAAVVVAGKIIEVSIHNHKNIPGEILGAKSKTGHLLRDYKFPEPVEVRNEKIVIVGGGISGLSAARWLKRKGYQDFVMLELSDITGGNAVSGENEVSRYPWGAHYIPVPDIEMKELLQFLEECGTITGYDNAGLPMYNEYHLCADPEERLYINGMWQDGLVPHFGVPENERQQITRFFDLVNQFKQAVGKDRKPAFAIPASRCSMDEEFLSFDKISFSDYLQQQNFTSAYLLWYLNYCMRDDFGTTSVNTSAWAGIHYFASRKGTAANAGHSDVITWPEGNAFLAGKLKEATGAVPQTNALVYSVERRGEKIRVKYFDVNSSTSKAIIADRVIMATPQFVNQKIFAEGFRNELDYSKFTYAPWMVANVTVSEMPQAHGKPLSWDNVFFDSDSLGYVNACQQHLNGYEKNKVLTYYLPLSGTDPKSARLAAYGKTHEHWTQVILNDLERAHKGITEKIERIDVWLWGHGMIRPVPGFITSEARGIAGQPVEKKIFFAHTDLSGISIFEEGFYHGIRAAELLIQSLKANA